MDGVKVKTLLKINFGNDYVLKRFGFIFQSYNLLAQEHRLLKMLELPLLYKQ